MIKLLTGKIVKPEQRKYLYRLRDQLLKKTGIDIGKKGGFKKAEEVRKCKK